MNVGWLRWKLKDIDPDTEVCLKIDLGPVTEQGAVYASATGIDFSDVENHDVVYIEADEY